MTKKPIFSAVPRRGSSISRCSQRFRLSASRTRFRVTGTISESRGPEAENAVNFVNGEAAFDQHVIDVRDQFAGGKPHLMGIEHMSVEHDRHQLRGRFGTVPARFCDQPAALLMVIGELLDPHLQSMERYA